MILINGEFKDHIPVTDRAFQYGDGLFETLTVVDGHPVFWDQHWDRLQSGCRRLNIPVPDAELIYSEAKSLCERQPTAVLKIIITRGSGGRGYRQPDCITPTRVLSIHPYPDYPRSYREQGIVARFCNTRLGINPSLAGIKHLNRLEQVLARGEWNDGSIQEGIMLDSNDQVIEGTMTNLFYIKNDTLHTPSIAQAGIAGIMRGIILNLAPGLGLPTIEHFYAKKELFSADEVFVCNSIIGIWPVTKIEEHAFPVGPKTQLIQQQLDRFTVEAQQR
jgi:4-amino-4-deoxychorismate lyase